MANFIKNVLGIAPATAVLIGTGLLLYPAFSDYWNSFYQSRAIMNYEEAVRGFNKDEYDRVFRAAEAYNKSILKRENPYAMSDEELTSYFEQLDLVGNGIMGYVDIPAIEVVLPIYHGTSESVLSVAVGHLQWTSLPVGGESTHSVLSGHSGLPSARLFTDLEKLSEGDGFTLNILDRKIDYVIDKISVVLPDEVSGLLPLPGKDLCTLVTCVPYGINSHRILLRARRAFEGGEPSLQATNSVSNSVSSAAPNERSVLNETSISKALNNSLETKGSMRILCMPDGIKPDGLRFNLYYLSDVSPADIFYYDISPEDAFSSYILYDASQSDTSSGYFSPEASLADAFSGVYPTDPLSDSNISSEFFASQEDEGQKLNDELIYAIGSYINDNNIKPAATGLTKGGIANISGLEEGIYFVLCDTSYKSEDGKEYTPVPFIIRMGSSLAEAEVKFTMTTVSPSPTPTPPSTLTPTPTPFPSQIPSVPATLPPLIQIPTLPTLSPSVPAVPTPSPSVPALLNSPIFPLPTSPILPIPTPVPPSINYPFNELSENYRWVMPDSYSYRTFDPDSGIDRSADNYKANTDRKAFDDKALENKTLDNGASEGQKRRVLDELVPLVELSSSDSDNEGLPHSTTVSTLPKTGLLWWPVPYLIISGILMTVAGAWKRSKL